MLSEIKVDIKSKIPIYKQLIQSVENLVSSNKYKIGEFLPSMNELSESLEISKETVKKAYSILRDNGLIESSHGKGFYITDKGKKRIKILLLFDKISTYKQVLYNSFVEEIGDLAEITIRLHNQDVELFEHYIDENINRFNYYIITPHFPLWPLVQKRAIKAIKRIPNRKLILLDHKIEGISGNFGAVYQDFENDIVLGLNEAADKLKKIRKLNVISMPSSLYAPTIERGIIRFCTDNNINFEILKKNVPEKLNKGEAYLILNGQLDNELIELISTAKMKGISIGKDIGVLSYNESPINKIILDGLSVFSTDFNQMGKLAAKMILDKSFSKIKCDFKLIRRNTF